LIVVIVYFDCVNIRFFSDKSLLKEFFDVNLNFVLLTLSPPEKVFFKKH